MFKMKITLDVGARMPVKAHNTDAGFDLFARDTKVVPARGCATFDTGVHIELPKIHLSDGMFIFVLNTTGFLKSKSGLNVKYGITSEGVIDVGYTGSIVVKLYNHSNEDYIVRVGDKITQLVILPVVDVGELEVVERLDETERNDNGFGSTGR
jgi:dUTP pyrophosphatase